MKYLFDKDVCVTAFILKSNQIYCWKACIYIQVIINVNFPIAGKIDKCKQTFPDGCPTMGNNNMTNVGEEGMIRLAIDVRYC